MNTFKRIFVCIVVLLYCTITGYNAPTSNKQEHNNIRKNDIEPITLVDDKAKSNNSELKGITNNDATVFAPKEESLDKVSITNEFVPIKAAATLDVPSENNESRTEPVSQQTSSVSTTDNAPSAQPNQTPATPTPTINLPTSNSSSHEHSYTSALTEPTCTTKGYTTYACKCGKSYDDDYTEKSDHSWSEWVVTKEATTESTGSRKKTCENCGTAETEVIEKHAISSGNTITLNGYSIGKEFEDTMTYPSESDFGTYYDNAITVYDALTAGESSVIVSFEAPTDSDLPLKERLGAVSDAIANFESTFNSKVLNGSASLVADSEDYITGTVNYNLDRARTVFNDLKAKQNLYYNANITAGLYNGMSEKEAVTKITNWICSNISYASGVNSPKDALSTGLANCDGYAKLFYYMCQNAGISCQYVVGCAYSSDINSSGCPSCHAWNSVKIGGYWYYIDICWRDSVGGYFLTDVLWADRSISHETAL